MACTQFFWLFTFFFVKCRIHSSEKRVDMLEIWWVDIINRFFCSSESPIFLRYAGDIHSCVRAETAHILKCNYCNVWRTFPYRFNYFSARRTVISDSSHMPHNSVQNSINYVGTHDNNTILGWLWEASDEERKFALEYCCFELNCAACGRSRN